MVKCSLSVGNCLGGQRCAPERQIDCPEYDGRIGVSLEELEAKIMKSGALVRNLRYNAKFR